MVSPVGVAFSVASGLTELRVGVPFSTAMGLSEPGVGMAFSSALGLPEPGVAMKGSCVPLPPLATLHLQWSGRLTETLATLRR